MTQNECFAVLDLTVDSSQADVRIAYRQLVVVWHPDRFNDPVLREKAHANLVLINAAYNALCNYAFTPEQSEGARKPTMEEMRRKHAEELAQTEARTKAARELAETEKQRAAVWGAFIGKVWRPCSILAVSIGACAFIITASYIRATHQNGEMIRLRHNDALLEAEIARLTARKAESERQSALAKAQAAAAEIESTATAIVRDKQRVIQLETSEELERARLRYVAAEAPRVEAEKQLLETIRNSPLVAYHESKRLLPMALERENSRPGVVAKRCKRRIELLGLLADEFNAKKQDLEKSITTTDKKLYQLSKLEELYSAQRTTICSLSTLYELENYSKGLPSQSSKSE